MGDREPTYNQDTLKEEWAIAVHPDMVTVGPCIILVEAGDSSSERIARMLAEHVKCLHTRALYEYSELKRQLEGMRPLPPPYKFVERSHAAKTDARKARG